jgi:hypothetical protein
LLAGNDSFQVGNILFDFSESRLQLSRCPRHSCLRASKWTIRF